MTAANFLQRYAKQYSAGAFATPTAKELAAAPDSVRDWQTDSGRTVAVVKTLNRDSNRRDWTGRIFTMPARARVVTHLARDAAAAVPDMSEFDYISAYREDHALADGLESQRRVPIATRITAASEIITVWGPPGSRSAHYPPYDTATVTRIPFDVPARTRKAVLAELSGVQSWHDDYPFYSDGSWSAVSLRGFWPDDPTRGVKPTEMPKVWREEHRAELHNRCDWTVLADRCPAMRELVESVSWWGRLERVRLLQMAGRGGRGGKLGRHTDITDRDGGTRDGQVVRFHLPLVTDPKIVMRSWDLTGSQSATHLPAWTLWYLDARKPHAVTNPTGVDRVHLVADVVCDADVRQRISDAA